MPIDIVSNKCNCSLCGHARINATYRCSSLRQDQSPDPLRRNWEYLQLLRQGKSDLDVRLPEEATTIEERALGGFINHSLRIMLRIGLHHEESWRPLLNQEPGLHYLEDIINFEKSLKKSEPGNPVEFKGLELKFHSSEAVESAGSLRQTQHQLVCWIDDVKINGLRTHCLCQPFKDLSNPPE
jgi:hypothetical protein